MISTHTCTYSAPASSPRNITITHISPTSVSVSWAPPPAEDHNGIIQRFQLQLYGGQPEELLTRNTLSTTILFDSLDENSNYSLRIAARTVERGPFSQPTNFSTLPDSKHMHGVSYNYNHMTLFPTKARA